MDLGELTTTIENRNELAAFIRVLRSDLHNKPESWENADLALFLEALAAWIEDMDGYFENTNQKTPNEPSWQLIATMLLAARHYE